VLTVHLLFDLFVFLAIVAARNPEALPIFLIVWFVRWLRKPKTAQPPATSSSDPIPDTF